MDCHAVDVAGCESIMQTIMEYPNSITSWTHTPGEKDTYDMNMRTSTSNGEYIDWRVEVKDRNCTMGRYNTAYIRENKFRSMTTDVLKEPAVFCGYPDGVLAWQLNMLPVSDILNDIADSKAKFKESEHINENRVSYNKWTEWVRVDNPVMGNRWELNVNLPIYKDEKGNVLKNKKGFRSFKKHVS